MITIINIAWAAGVYEGEGSFSGNTARIGQKDGWLTYELQRLFGGTVSLYNGYHYWTLTGETCRGFILTIFSFLSPRRKAQILKYPLFFKDPNFLPANFCPNGHEYTQDNIFMETGYKENGEPRQWRTCKICRKDHYDRKNEKRRNESPEEKAIKIIAKAKSIPFEDAKAIFEKTLGMIQ